MSNWKLVPVEPTNKQCEEMFRARYKEGSTVADIYAAAVANAPKPPIASDLSACVHIMRSVCTDDLDRQIFDDVLKLIELTGGAT